MAKVPEPRLDRSVTLHCKGDWGIANLHRVLGWLSYEIGLRSGSHTRIAIWNGHGMVDSAHAVGRGEVDLAVVVPQPAAPMALDGRGPFEGEAYPKLRAIGAVPQDDRLVFAVRAEHGIKSFADLRRKRAALRITTGADDGINFVGFAVHRVMELAGIPDETLADWGGSYLTGTRPMDCIADVRAGRADAIFHEAIMTSYWHELTDEIAFEFVSIEPRVLGEMKRRYGWPAGRLPKGYFRRMNRPLRTLDFSDFLIVVRDDMPADVAYLITWCLNETRANLERQYLHIPPERSPVSYPLKPAKMARTSIPLHRGALRYYRDAGVLEDGAARRRR